MDREGHNWLMERLDAQLAAHSGAGDWVGWALLGELPKTSPVGWHRVQWSDGSFDMHNAPHSGYWPDWAFHCNPANGRHIVRVWVKDEAQ